MRKKLTQIMVSILAMGIVSIVALLLLSSLAYTFRLKPDDAMLGITCIYILAGYCGGLSLKVLQNRQGKQKESGVQVQKEQVSMGRKMLEGIILGSLFMGMLLLVSWVVLQRDIVIQGRLLMIWMLTVGSASLGRIL